MKNKWTAFLILFIAIFSFPLVTAGGDRKECSVCGMYLDLYESTKHMIVFTDGTEEETCSLACAAKIYRREQKRVVRIMVADFLTGTLIEADKAWYLEGSDVPGVMSYTSRIAFKDKVGAVQFQKKHGGRIISFKEAMEHEMEE
jgi:nitrous oxide reductase accessory protein NosL